MALNKKDMTNWSPEQWEAYLDKTE